jgi:hypothetical protein
MVIQSRARAIASKTQLCFYANSKSTSLELTGEEDLIRSSSLKQLSRNLSPLTLAFHRDSRQTDYALKLALSMTRAYAPLSYRQARTMTRSVLVLIDGRINIAFCMIFTQLVSSLYRVL